MSNKTRQRVIKNEAKYIRDIVTQLSCMEVNHKERASLKNKLLHITKRYIILLDAEESEKI